MGKYSVWNPLKWKHSTYKLAYLWWGLFCEFVWRFLIFWIVFVGVLYDKFKPLDVDCLTMQACVWHSKALLFFAVIGLTWVLNPAFVKWNWSLAKK